MNAAPWIGPHCAAPCEHDSESAASACRALAPDSTTAQVEHLERELAFARSERRRWVSNHAHVVDGKHRDAAAQARVIAAQAATITRLRSLSLDLVDAAGGDDDAVYEACGRAVVDEFAKGIDPNRPYVAVDLADAETMAVFLEQHPRFAKVLRSGRPFIIVAVDEPYAKTVAGLIRHAERASGAWTAADDEWFGWHFNSIADTSHAALIIERDALAMRVDNEAVLVDQVAKGCARIADLEVIARRRGVCLNAAADKIEALSAEAAAATGEAAAAALVVHQERVDNTALRALLAEAKAGGDVLSRALGVAGDELGALQQQGAEARAEIEHIRGKAQAMADLLAPAHAHPFVDDALHPGECGHAIWKNGAPFQCCGFPVAGHGAASSSFDALPTTEEAQRQLIVLTTQNEEMAKGLEDSAAEMEGVRDEILVTLQGCIPIDSGAFKGVIMAAAAEGLDREVPEKKREGVAEEIADAVIASFKETMKEEVQ